MDERVFSSSSYTMDYKKKEIVLTIYAKDSQEQTRLTEKDVLSMAKWFLLANMKK